jgi:hypothetical protein
MCAPMCGAVDSAWKAPSDPLLAWRIVLNTGVLRFIAPAGERRSVNHCIIISISNPNCFEGI